MKVLGISGGFGLHGENFIPGLKPWFFHDSAAAVVDGRDVIAAIEEERLTRVKHANTLPVNAARHVLALSGLRAASIDAVAYFFSERYSSHELAVEALENSAVPLRNPRSLIVERLLRPLGLSEDPDRLVFVPHHLTHVAAAFNHSGFEHALTIVSDGNSEDAALSAYRSDGGRHQLMRCEPIRKSLGHLYTLAVQTLGYRRFDEYKVMGLAPYGDEERFKQLFESVIALGPNGTYDLDLTDARDHFLRVLPPRRLAAPLAQVHSDFAAGLQAAIERVSLHIASHLQQITGEENLCLAGGVALNCSLNGRLARSGQFRRLFVHPASHDGGAAVGAAMHVAGRNGSLPIRPQLRRVDWGCAISASEVTTLLSRWSAYVHVDSAPDPVRRAAELLSAGKVIGWARGRMEFGPRALGFRSILADPRPFANRDRINAVVKKRESYRPFAPVVLAERARDWFDLPDIDCNYNFMGVIVHVAEDKRAQLGAVTHVDGTARIQIVNAESNADLTELLKHFEALTGVPVLLNTSLNTNAEPVVATAGEALLCFLTSNMDGLMLGDHLVTRVDLTDDFWLDLIPEPRRDVFVTRSDGAGQTKHQLAFLHTDSSHAVTSGLGAAFVRFDGIASFRDCGFGTGQGTCGVREIMWLLEQRAVRIRGLDLAVNSEELEMTDADLEVSDGN